MKQSAKTIRELLLAVALSLTFSLAEAVPTEFYFSTNALISVDGGNQVVAPVTYSWFGDPADSNGVFYYPGYHAESLTATSSRLNTPFGSTKDVGIASLLHEFSSCCSFWTIPVGRVNVYPWGGYVLGEMQNIGQPDQAWIPLHTPLIFELQRQVSPTDIYFNTSFSFMADGRPITGELRLFDLYDAIDHHVSGPDVVTFGARIGTPQRALSEPGGLSLVFVIALSAVITARTKHTQRT